MKDPMKSIPFLPKIVPGVGWDHVGVGWVMQGWGGVGHVGVGWGGSCRGGVCHAGVGWGVSCRGGMGWVM